MEIDRALQSNELAVSAISFWEMEMLQRKQRIDFDYTVGLWRRHLMQEGLVEIPVDGETAIRAASLTGFHNDPADRFIVATAMAGHQLVTADRLILDWPGTLSTLDASR